MKKNVDQYIMVCDLQDAGYANFDYKQISKMAPVLSVRHLKVLASSNINYEFILI
jgi:hypothetical protein